MMPPPGQLMGCQSGFTWGRLGLSRGEGGLESARLEPHVLGLCFLTAPALPLLSEMVCRSGVMQSQAFVSSSCRECLCVQRNGLGTCFACGSGGTVGWSTPPQEPQRCACLSAGMGPQRSMQTLSLLWPLCGPYPYVTQLLYLPLCRRGCMHTPSSWSTPWQLWLSRCTSIWAHTRLHAPGSHPVLGQCRQPWRQPLCLSCCACRPAGMGGPRPMQPAYAGCVPPGPGMMPYGAPPGAPGPFMGAPPGYGPPPGKWQRQALCWGLHQVPGCKSVLHQRGWLL